MNIQAVPTTSVGGQRNLSLEQVSAQKKEMEKVADRPQTDVAENKVQPEELLDQIKALTQEGQYSVRFEVNDVADLVVQIFDKDSNEMVRQIPSEELVNFKASFSDLLGNIVDMKG